MLGGSNDFEEVVEVLPQCVPDEDDVVSERDLVLRQVLADLVLHYALPVLDVLQALLNELRKCFL